MNALYCTLVDEHRISKKINAKSFASLAEKIRKKAVPHHSFHVFNIWRRTGHLDRAHTLESMDSCRVSWGEIKNIDGPLITVVTEPLTIINGKLALGSPMEKRIVRHL